MRLFCLKTKTASVASLLRSCPIIIVLTVSTSGPVLYPPQHSACRIKEVIDSKPTADLRTALLVATGDMAKRKTKGDKQIADFAKTVVDSSAVRATKDTAGGHGIDVFMAGCEDTSYYVACASRKGACYMLSSLATAPCTKE